jgi:hypothetical protein
MRQYCGADERPLNELFMFLARLGNRQDLREFGEKKDRVSLLLALAISMTI